MKISALVFDSLRGLQKGVLNVILHPQLMFQLTYGSSNMNRDCYWGPVAGIQIGYVDW